MWAAIDRLQRELVGRRKLLTTDDQKSLMLAAAMIPAPKFLAFAAMVGYRAGGIWGAVGFMVSQAISSGFLTCETTSCCSSGAIFPKTTNFESR